jgi:Ca-activated chloride channel family protein
VTGRRNGRKERISARAIFPATEPENDFIPRLWASRKIGELTRQVRLEGASDGLISQVRELGLRYGIVTEYTSYLVQEPIQEFARRADPGSLRQEDRNVAPAPVAQTGREAFERARASSKFSESKTLADADAVAGEALATLAPAAASPRETRRIGGRIFVHRDQVWTDIGHADRITITEVEPYSKAYFELVRQLPQLVPYLSLGDRILIAGKHCSIRLSPNGTQVWQPGELATVVRNFKGT